MWGGSANRSQTQRDRSFQDYIHICSLCSFILCNVLAHCTIVVFKKIENRLQKKSIHITINVLLEMLHQRNNNNNKKQKFNPYRKFFLRSNNRMVY